MRIALSTFPSGRRRDIATGLYRALSLKTEIASCFSKPAYDSREIDRKITAVKFQNIAAGQSKLTAQTLAAPAFAGRRLTEVAAL
jgi:hypothetical protein